MTVESLYPTFDGPTATWTLDGGDTIFNSLSVDDNTDDTKRSRLGSALTDHEWYLGALPVATEVSNVDSKMYARVSGSAEMGVYCEDSANKNFFRPGAAIGGSAGNYVTLEDLNVSHPTNASWAPEDFVGDGSPVWWGVDRTVDGGSSSFVTYWRVNVTFVPPAGGFRWLLNMWLPPLIAAASHGASFAEIGLFLSDLRVRPSGRDELERVMRELVRRPSYG